MQSRTTLENSFLNGLIHIYMQPGCPSSVCFPQRLLHKHSQQPECNQTSNGHTNTRTPYKEILSNKTNKLVVVSQKHYAKGQKPEETPDHAVSSFTCNSRKGKTTVTEEQWLPKTGGGGEGLAAEGTELLRTMG